MDDCIDSLHSEIEEIKLIRQLKEIWGHAGMEVHKWASNSEKLMQLVPEEKRSKNITFEEEGATTTKTLGLKWDVSKDIYCFDARKMDGEIKMTKRTLLSQIARIFDPLGFLSCVTIKGKILMQKL